MDILPSTSSQGTSPQSSNTKHVRFTIPEKKLSKNDPLRNIKRNFNFSSRPLFKSKSAKHLSTKKAVTAILKSKSSRILRRNKSSLKKGVAKITEVTDVVLKANAEAEMYADSEQTMEVVTSVDSSVEMGDLVEEEAGQIDLNAKAENSVEMLELSAEEYTRNSIIKEADSIVDIQMLEDKNNNCSIHFQVKEKQSCKRKNVKAATRKTKTAKSTKRREPKRRKSVRKTIHKRSDIFHDDRIRYLLCKKISSRSTKSKKAKCKKNKSKNSESPWSKKTSKSTNCSKSLVRSKELKRKLAHRVKKAAQKKQALKELAARKRKTPNKENTTCKPRGKVKARKPREPRKPRERRILPRLREEDTEEPLGPNLLRYLTLKHADDNDLNCCEDNCWHDWDCISISDIIEDLD